MQVWDCRRRLPPSLYCNPLNALFDEFDANGNGSLTADVIHSVLHSKGVDITKEQVRKFIDSADVNGDRHIHKDEFENFLYGLANAEYMHEA